jgi:hypothetical protein
MHQHQVQRLRQHKGSCHVEPDPNTSVQQRNAETRSTATYNRAAHSQTSDSKAFIYNDCNAKAKTLPKFHIGRTSACKSEDTPAT